MDMLEFIKSRRSTRAFAPKPVEEEKLIQVLEAGRHAPSGGNNQRTHFIVVENEEVKEKLARMAEAAFAKMTETEDTYPSLRTSIRSSKKGGYYFHFHAPVVILCANWKDYGNHMADTSCAMENMMLMANALDLGSCWLNQLNWLNEDEEINQYLFSLGMQENERVYASLALGYPATESGLPNREPLPRKGNVVTRIK